MELRATSALSVTDVWRTVESALATLTSDGVAQAAIEGEAIEERDGSVTLAELAADGVHLDEARPIGLRLIGQRQEATFAAGDRPERGRWRPVRVQGRLALDRLDARLQVRATRLVATDGEGPIARRVAEATALMADVTIDERRRNVLPELPRRVRFIGGARSAARSDLERALGPWRTAGVVEIVLDAVPMAGPGCVERICARLADVSADDADVVVLARGAGGTVDLLPFSDPDLCRAVLACRVPVIPAIGTSADAPIVGRHVLAVETPLAAGRLLADLLVTGGQRLRREVESAREASDRVVTAAEERLAIADERATGMLQRARRRVRLAAAMATATVVGAVVGLDVAAGGGAAALVGGATVLSLGTAVALRGREERAELPGVDPAAPVEAQLDAVDADLATVPRLWSPFGIGARERALRDRLEAARLALDEPHSPLLPAGEAQRVAALRQAADIGDVRGARERRVLLQSLAPLVADLERGLAADRR